MKFIKKNIKLIIGILIGMLLISGISIYATYKYVAIDVSYTREGIEMSVADALNNLYDRINDINKTDAVASDILSGKKAYTKMV